MLQKACAYHGQRASACKGNHMLAEKSAIMQGARQEQSRRRRRRGKERERGGVLQHFVKPASMHRSGYIRVGKHRSRCLLTNHVKKIRETVFCQRKKSCQTWKVKLLIGLVALVEARMRDAFCDSCYQANSALLNSSLHNLSLSLSLSLPLSPQSLSYGREQ